MQTIHQRTLSTCSDGKDERAIIDGSMLARFRWEPLDGDKKVSSNQRQQRTCSGALEQGGAGGTHMLHQHCQPCWRAKTNGLGHQDAAAHVDVVRLARHGAALELEGGHV